MHSLTPPFSITLPDAAGDNDLECRQAVRTLPGRRLVCAGHWQGRNVYAKLFYNSRKARRDWQRERHGISHLLAASIPTPPLLYSGFLPDRECYILVLGAVEPAMTLKEAWAAAATPELRDALLAAMARTLAEHHNAGILHHDPHLNNFLVSGETIHTLDGADVEQHGKPLRGRTALANLAAFFSVLHLGPGEASRRFFGTYSAHRESVTGRDDYLVFLKSLANTTRKNIRKYLHEKIFRECTEFARRRTFNRLTILNRRYDSPVLQELLANPESFAQLPQVATIKQGNTSIVSLARIGQQNIVIKYYRIKGLLHGLKRSMQRTRAEKSWINAHRLIISGIKTAAPIAIIVNKTGPFRHDAWFLTEHVDGMYLDDFLTSQPTTHADKRHMAEQLAGMLRKLAANRITHGDLKSSNILVVDKEPVLMDLDSMKQHRSGILFRRQFRKDLERLMRNWTTGSEFSGLLEASVADLAKKYTKAP